MIPESKRHFTSAQDEDPHACITVAPPAYADGLSERPTPGPFVGPRSELHLRAPLEAGARTGSSLGELSEVVTELSTGLSGAKQANERLVRELETMRAIIGSLTLQKAALERRVGEVEETLALAEETARSERQLLTEQHDEFLAAVLEEHELERRALASEGPRPSSSELAERLARVQTEHEQAQTARFALESELSRAHEALSRAEEARDEARARADKRERERDELRAEASRLRARLGVALPSTEPPPPVATPSRPPSSGAPVAIALDEGELDTNLHVTPRLPNVAPRLGATLAPERSRPPSSSPFATATPFPRETTRPGVGPRPAPSAPTPSFGPPPSGWTPPVPPAQEAPPSVRLQSAAYLPQAQPGISPLLKQKPDPTTRPLIDYSLGEGGVQSELLEGARLSTPPSRK